jgi:hypothetical protein
MGPEKIWISLAGWALGKQNTRNSPPNLQISGAILQIFPKNALVESSDFKGFCPRAARFFL